MGGEDRGCGITRKINNYFEKRQDFNYYNNPNQNFIKLSEIFIIHKGDNLRLGHRLCVLCVES